MPKLAKIAIIEDDMAIAHMYRTKFEADGFQVETAGDGVSGLELIGSFDPDVILLDLMMPHMDGIEMLGKLRETPKGREARVIILTNLGDEDTMKTLQAMNPTDYIVKATMTPREVSGRVKDLLGLA